MSLGLVTTITLLYVGLLFTVAYMADSRQRISSLIANPAVYSLSLAVYFTSWTFYGSVGRAATSGLDFLPTYLGPTLIAFTWWFLLRKMVRISKEQNIVSIADFISSRYGKSASLGAVVTIFAVLGIMPYIALQLKAISTSFNLICPPEATGYSADTALAMAVLLSLFSVLFGARHLSTTERHEGMVAAIALESLVKIVAFVAVGLFVTFGLFDGFGDIFNRFLNQFPERADLLLMETAQIPYTSWFTLTFVAMMAIMFLPRQFHIMVIENTDEKHILSAMWGFPAYMFLLNLFVIPIALGGLLINQGDVSGADYFVLSLPLQHDYPALALLVFVGGFSASAGMVMVEAVALSTMILNHLIMPVILKLRFDMVDFSGLLIHLKRLGIVAVIFLGYFYCHVIGDSYALINIGLTSFLAATQFAPALIGGLYWRRANGRAALVGLCLGFIVWFYTLLIPSFVRSGWLDTHILENGPFHIALLKPLELFGLSGFDIWTHALFWTLFFNLGAFLALSLLTPAPESELEQREKFINAFGLSRQPQERQRISKAPSIIEFVDLMTKFIGEKQAHTAIANYVGDREIDERGSLSEFELPNLKRFAERTLAGSVGAAPARIIIENYLEARGSQMEDVFDIFGSVNLSRTSSREQLSVLYEAARVVASGDELQQILDNILDLFIQQFKFDLCVIRLIDIEKKTLTVRSQRGMSSLHLGESERELTQETYIGSTYLNNSVVVINDSDFMEKAKSAQIIHREGIKSFAHAPIAIEGEVIGVISAFSRSVKGVFTSEFVELFTSLAGQVGVAWRNAQQTERIITAREHEREMQIAKTIQLGLLPARTPDLKGIDLAGICVPAHQVGGDYYDYLLRDDGTLDLVIADVSGHNIGAALLMVEARTFIQSRARSLSSPSLIMAELNRFFYDDLTRSELFITLFYLTFDPKTRIATYASAGHNPPLLWRAATRTIERLDAEGLILGVRPTVTFDQEQVDMLSGDLLLLYTDGITEAENDQGEFFGDERLCALLDEFHALAASEIREQMLHQVRLFTGIHHFKDDVSLVIMRIDGETSG